MTLNSTKKTETNRYELEISVGKEEFEEGCAEAYRKNVGKINVPGFRPGKAPRSIIEKMYGKEVFYEEAVNALYPKAYSDAIEEAKLEPVDRADVEVLSVDENGFKFKATVTVKPEVEVKNYKGIKATKTVKKVTDEDINAEIDNLRERNGRIINVDDRESKMGDITVIDYEGFVDGVAFDGGKAEKQTLTLGSNQFIPGFEDQVAGHKIGDEFDVNVKFPEEYHASELAGKPAVFKCKLHEIKVRELPEVDDEFIKDVTEFDSLDEFKKDAASKLEAHFEEHASIDLENDLIDSVVENLTAEIPECMFEHSVDEMVQDFASRLEAQGMKLDLYLQYSGMDIDAFRKTFRPQAEKQVKIRLALEKIVKLENIKPTAEELDAEYKKLAENYNIDAEKIKGYIPASEIEKEISMQKAIDFVRDNAVVTEKSASEKKPAAKKTAAKKTEEKAEDGEKKAPAKKTASTAKKTTTSAAEKKPAAKKTTASKTAAADKKPAAKKTTAKKAEKAE